MSCQRCHYQNSPVSTGSIRRPPKHTHIGGHYRVSVSCYEGAGSGGWDEAKCWSPDFYGFTEHSPRCPASAHDSTVSGEQVLLRYIPCIKLNRWAYAKVLTRDWRIELMSGTNRERRAPTARLWGTNGGMSRRGQISSKAATPSHMPLPLTRHGQMSWRLAFSGLLRGGLGAVATLAATDPRISANSSRKPGYSIREFSVNMRALPGRPSLNGRSDSCRGKRSLQKRGGGLGERGEG